MDHLFGKAAGNRFVIHTRGTGHLYLCVLDEEVDSCT